MKRMKALLCMLPLLLTGCGGGLGSTESRSMLEQEATAAIETAATEELPEGAITDVSGSFVYTGKLEQIGDDDNGYIQVPLGWMEFHEEGVEGMVQYSDATGKNIVTLEHYEGIDYQSAAENMRYYLAENQKIEGLTGSTTTIGGYDALQLYCHYTDGYFLVIWFAQDPADAASSYYIAMEFDNDHQYVVACSSTFQSTEDYHAQNG